MQALYVREMGAQSVKEIVYRIFSAGSYADEVKEFVNALVNKTVDNIGKIDDLITKNATNWRIERIAVIDRNILRLAICEFLYFPEIPPKASIDEAIELAKKYSTSESGKFVNGVLDSVLKNEINKQ